MAAVQIPFVEKLQTKFQETYYTILKYKNEIIFVPSFVFIGLFLRPCCFRKKHWTKKRIYSCLRVEQMCGKFGAVNLDFICTGR